MDVSPTNKMLVALKAVKRGGWEARETDRCLGMRCRIC